MAAMAAPAMAALAMASDALCNIGLRNPAVSMEAQTILESVTNTADAAAGLARLLGTAEETDVVDTAAIRGLDGYSISKDPAMAGAFVLKLRALENGIKAAAAAATPAVAYVEVLADVSDANSGGIWRGRIARAVEAADEAARDAKMAVQLAKEKAARIQMEKEAEDEAERRARGRAAASGIGAIGGIGGGGGGGLSLGGVGGGDEVSAKQEGALSASFRAMYAFSIAEEKRGNRAALRTMERHLIEQQSWPSEAQLSFLKIKSGAHGGAKPARELAVSAEGTIAVAAKDEEAEAIKGSWHVVTAYSRKLMTALYVGHGVEAWHGYEAGKAGVSPAAGKRFIIAYREVLEMIEALEAGARAGVDKNAMYTYVCNMDAEIRQAVIGEDLMLPGAAIAALVGQTRRELALSVTTPVKKKKDDDATAGGADDSTLLTRAESKKILKELQRYRPYPHGGGGKGNGGWRRYSATSSGAGARGSKGFAGRGAARAIGRAEAYTLARLADAIIAAAKAPADGGGGRARILAATLLVLLEGNAAGAGWAEGAVGGSRRARERARMAWTSTSILEGAAGG